MKLSQATKEAKERIKQNKPKETKMKNLKTPLTVLATLLVVAAFAATFFAGTQYQQGQHQTIKTEATALVTQLKSDAK